MKHFLLTSSILLASILPLAAQDADDSGGQLYPVVENELWGFIDSTGRVVIRPKYHAAGFFSEGLAPVREKGRYGYINVRGEYVIEPMFDYAQIFMDGMARVYIDSVPSYIDRTGEKVFGHDFVDIDFFGYHTYAIVTTSGGKQGVIDRSGDLIVDTLYGLIGWFNNGYASVDSLYDRRKSYSTEQTIPARGVVDTTGRWVIPIGRYESVSLFHDGIALVRPYHEGHSSLVGESLIIDSTGRTLYTHTLRQWRFDELRNPYYSEGRAIVSLRPYVADSILQREYWKQSHPGIVDRDGNLLFECHECRSISRFTNGRAFAVDTNGTTRMIDRNATVVRMFDSLISFSPLSFDNQDGYFLITDRSGYRIVDTNGIVIAVPHPLKPSIHPYPGNDRFMRLADRFRHWGYWDPVLNIVVEPRFDQIEDHRLGAAVMAVVEDGRFGYINAHGEYIWREKNDSVQSPAPLNLDYRLMPHFPAVGNPLSILVPQNSRTASMCYRPLDDPSRYGGIDSLYLEIIPEDKAGVNELTGRLLLRLINLSDTTISLDAIANNLGIVLEAKTPAGIWSSIADRSKERFYGCAYEDLHLPPDMYWKFRLPAFDGELNTVLRARLNYRYRDSDTIRTTFSNEVPAHLNPGQFWRATIQKTHMEHLEGYRY